MRRPAPWWKTVRDPRLGRPAALLVLVGMGVFAVAPRFSVATDDQPFLTSDRCIACHKGITTSEGQDVSIGFDWRPTMMANSGRDPYWQAAVRRELVDHPDASAAIQNECSRCHMPMANETARRGGGTGSVFANVPHAANPGPEAALAADGVSCSICHQIRPDGLGEEESFVGGFTIAAAGPPDGRRVFGPFEPDEGGVGIMRSATGYRPTEGSHVQTSELCASCHTLLTHAILDTGHEGPEFPEQVPYQEWQASDFPGRGERCQTCHMPEVSEAVPVTSVLGQPRSEVSRHVFRGGNFFMLKVLSRYRDELGVMALPQELQLAAARTVDHLRGSTATVDVVPLESDDGTVSFDVRVRNLAGHKFPTAYPSRRAWLHVRVRDTVGRTVFESGAFRDDGSIAGNDNDERGDRYEPHHATIDDPRQVQIYEAVMVDENGTVTTGLLEADRWVKDNRLPPEGFDPSGAEHRIGVYGDAADDPSFGDGGDRVRYRIPDAGGRGPYDVEVELWFQPIGYRWAHNLDEYDTFETDRFGRYYREMASASALPVASMSARIRGAPDGGR
jgi:hypothetical protein